MALEPMYPNPSCYWETKRVPGRKMVNEFRVADIFHRDKPGVVVIQLRGYSIEIDDLAREIAKRNP